MMTSLAVEFAVHLDGGEVRRLRRILLRWFRLHARELPWRRGCDPYRVWVSEIILQQTRVEQGLPYFERFVAAFPTVESLAAAREQRVLKLWEGLGYYARARNLHRAARLIVRDFRGTFPLTAAAWMRLPGIGRYTAGAIASIAFGEPAPVVDGNVARVFARLFEIEAPVMSAGGRKALWLIAERLVPGKAPGAFNQALMELGATVCVPRRPVCDACPVGGLCRARAAGRADEYPVRTNRTVCPHRNIVMAVIRRNGRLLLRRRPRKGLLGGLWEFPSIRLEGKETVGSALRRLAEELGIEIGERRLLTVVRQAYTHFRSTVRVYACDADATGVVSLPVHSRWVRPRELKEYPLPKTHHKFLHLLAE